MILEVNKIRNTLSIVNKIQFYVKATLRKNLLSMSHTMRKKKRKIVVNSKTNTHDYQSKADLTLRFTEKLV